MSDIVSIGEGAFQDCSSITTIVIHSSVIDTYIGDGAFNGCSSLTSISIPDSVENIGEGAFRGCENLQTIYIPQGMTETYCQMGLENLRDKIVEQ